MGNGAAPQRLLALPMTKHMPPLMAAILGSSHITNYTLEVRPEVDDPEKLHLHIDGRVVYAHYTYKDRKGDLVDYVLQIHRSTGRFTETFKAAGDQSDNSGTCMIFKY